MRSQTTEQGSTVSGELVAVVLGETPRTPVGPGCQRWDLPSLDTVRFWVVDMAPGATWPVVDEHKTGEAYLVVSGEVIEGEQRFGAGTFVRFTPGSRHQPHTATGVRLLGITPR